MTSKTSTKHPYAAIDHRVIDSPAYADLSHSACRLLVIIARQLNKDNNGRLQATFKFCSARGIKSEHTLRGAISELISHGFIFKTRSHGANGAWAKYAVTWQKISTNREGLFLHNWKPEAWRDWRPEEKKTTPQKLMDQSGRKCSFPPLNPAESAGTLPVKTAAYELMPCRGVFGHHYKPIHSQRKKVAAPSRFVYRPASKVAYIGAHIH